jgi:ribose/xylose/arabinose/galactoside ABC-type transport system permease subunit
MLATFTVVWLVLRYTAFGRFTFAVGGNPRAAFLAGLHVDRVRVILYIASGLSAGLAGLVIASQLIAGSPQSATNLELNAVTAAVLGGASLTGGRGSFVGAVVGALFLSLIINILPLPNILPGFLREWSDALPLIIIGSLTLFALVLYQAPELLGRLRAGWAGVGRLRSRQGEVPAA